MSALPLVVVTGASSGIGAAIAAAFAAKGHPQLLLARRLDRMRALDLPGAECAAVDVTDAGALAAAIADAESRHGPVDCMVNNAGTMLLGRVATQDPAEWRRMLDVNVTGLMNGVRAVLPAMVRRSGGTIVNVSSVAGRKTFPNHAAYNATKFAVHAFSEGLREEIADRNVRVVTIAPGAVDTELVDHTTSARIKTAHAAWRESIGGAIAPEAVADAVLFAYGQPPNVCVREIVLAPTRQAS